MDSATKTITDPEAPGDLHTMVFDLETKKLAKDVGGWDALKRGAGGVSVLVVWDSRSGRHHLFDTSTLGFGIDLLEAADVVCSFNGIDFDAPILSGILGRPLHIKKHIDLLAMVRSEPTGRRKGNTLGDIAQRTLGYGKTGDGALAPQMYDEGRFAELHDYCIADVELTRLLFKTVQTEGGVISIDNQLMAFDLPAWFQGLDLGQFPKGN